MSRCGPGTVIVAQCQPDCPETPEIELTNGNLAGIGFLDSWDGLNGVFRGAEAGNSMIGITLNGTNHTVVFTPSISAIAAAFPAATESVSGSLQIATTAETTAGTNDATAVSPLKLQEKLDDLTLNKTIDTFSISSDTPDFWGQFAGLNDAAGGLVSTGTGAGDWAQMLTEGGYNQWGTATTLTLNAADLTFNGFSNSAILFTGLTNFNLNSPLNFGVASSIKIGGASLAVESLLGSVLGSAPAEILISDFVSAYNPQTWGVPTGTLARTTYATFPTQVINNPPTQVEVQAISTGLQVVSQRLAALIIDLQANLKPAL